MFNPTPVPSPATSPAKDIAFGIFDDVKEKITGFLKKELDALKEAMLVDFNELEEKSGAFAQNLGRGRTFAFGIRQSFADAMPDVVRLGGKIDDIAKLQAGVMTSTGRGIQLAGDEFAKLYASQKILNTEASTMFSTFKNIGVSIHDVGKETEKVIKTAASLGVNAEGVFEQVRRNIEKINAYNFQGGVEGLTRMAAKATALRIDMGTTMNFAEEVMNPEKAIEMANAFQRLGAGTSALLDPLKLMDLSMNDPEELQNQLVKMTQQFVKFDAATNKHIITNKRMFRELAKDLNIPYEELTKMALGGADLNRKLSDIKFPKDAVSQEDREMIANMSEMKEGNYVVRVMEGGQIKDKKVTELSKENIDYLKQQPKTAEEIMKQNLTSNQSMEADVAAIRARITGGVARSETSQALGNSMRNMTDQLNKFVGNLGLTPQNVGFATDKVVKSMIDALSGKGFGGFGKMIEDIKKSGTQIDLNDLASQFRTMFQSSELYTSQSSSQRGDLMKGFEDMLAKLFGKTQKTGDLLVTDKGLFKPDENDYKLFIKKERVDIKDPANLVAEGGNTTVQENKPMIQTIQTNGADMSLIKRLSEMMAVQNNNNANQTNKTEIDFTQPLKIEFDVTGTNDGNLMERFKELLETKRGLISDMILEKISSSMNNNGMTGGINKGTPNSFTKNR